MWITPMKELRLSTSYEGQFIVNYKLPLQTMIVSRSATSNTYMCGIKL